MVCHRCGTESADDRRLLLDCSYELDNSGIPFIQRPYFQPFDHDNFYASFVKRQESVRIGDENPVFMMGQVTLVTNSELLVKALYQLELCRDCRMEFVSMLRDWWQLGVVKKKTLLPIC